MKRFGFAKAFEKTTGTLDERLRGALAKVSLAARHEYRRQAAAEGLSAVQAQVLGLLAYEGSMEIGALAARLALTPATVSDSVAALEHRNLVRRKPLPSDRRRVGVEATVRGERIGRTVASWAELFQDGIADLSPAEKKVLFRVMIRIILSLLEKGTIQQARMCVTCAYFRPHAHRDAARPHHCALVGIPLGPTSLRIECPDHEQGISPSEARVHLGRWLEAVP